MSELTYNIDKQELSWLSHGKTWSAVTGPYGKGALPVGLYDLSRREVTPYTESAEGPYRDKSGKGFFVPIYPKFKTDRGGSGGRLGIHPDGNVPGTRGCIGITADAKSFHDLLSKTAPSIKLTLQVKKN